MVVYHNVCCTCLSVASLRHLPRRFESPTSGWLHATNAPTTPANYGSPPSVVLALPWSCTRGACSHHCCNFTATTSAEVQHLWTAPGQVTVQKTGRGPRQPRYLCHDTPATWYLLFFPIFNFCPPPTLLFSGSPRLSPSPSLPFSFAFFFFPPPPTLLHPTSLLPPSPQSAPAPTNSNLFSSLFHLLPSSAFPHLHLSTSTKPPSRSSLFTIHASLHLFFFFSSSPKQPPPLNPATFSRRASLDAPEKKFSDGIAYLIPTTRPSPSIDCSLSSLLLELPLTQR